MKNIVALLFLLFASQAHALFYCRCDTGAHGSCVAGSDSNDGLSAVAPKLNRPSEATLSAAAAGAQFRFCKGGAWDWSSTHVWENMNATAASPITLDSYDPPSGAAGRPIFRGTSSGVSIYFMGSFGNTTDDKGYVFRGLAFLPGSSGNCIAWNGTTSHIMVDDTLCDGAAIGYYVVGNVVSHFTLKNSTISNIAAHGFLGGPDDTLIENNDWTGINPSGSGFNHAIYFGTTNVKARATIRGNRLTNNSSPAGTCTGGNLTSHGRIDQLLVEDNVITVAASGAGCYGISLSPGGPGYTGGTPDEYNRRTIIRGNTIVGVGNNYITLAYSTNGIVENNRLISTAAQLAQGIVIENGDADDEATSAVTVKNNTCYFPAVTSVSSCVNISAGSSHILTNNLVYFGASAASSVRCFGLTALSNFTTADRNHCYFASGSGNYTDDYASLGLAQAAGMGTNDSTGDPLFAATPSSGNGWSLAVQSGSPVRSTGHVTHKSRRDVLGCLRDSTPDKGAHEFGGAPCSDIRAPTKIR